MGSLLQLPAEDQTVLPAEAVDDTGEACFRAGAPLSLQCFAAEA